MKLPTSQHFRYFPAVLPWLLLAALYAPVFYILYKERWEMIDYGHAPFILPIALFIVWLKIGAEIFSLFGVPIRTAMARAKGVVFCC